MSKRVPGWMVGELEVAEIQSNPGSDPGHDRHDVDALPGKHRHPQAGHDISGTIDPEVALIERVDRRKVVDQHHCPVAIGAEIEADGRSLPIDLMLASVLGIKHALAVTDAADDRAAPLLPDDIAI